MNGSATFTKNQSMMIVENTLKSNNSIEEKNPRDNSTGDFIQGANVNYDYNSSVS